MRSEDGFLPIHKVALSRRKEKAETIKFLIMYDPDGASRVTRDGDGGQLSLHIAYGCYGGIVNLNAVKQLFEKWGDSVQNCQKNQAEIKSMLFFL